MAQKHNFFALLADEESDDITQLISRVKEEKMNKNSSMEQVQKEKNEEKKMAHQNIPTDHMQAKRFPRNNGNCIINICILFLILELEHLLLFVLLLICSFYIMHNNIIRFCIYYIQIKNDRSFFLNESGIFISFENSC